MVSDFSFNLRVLFKNVRFIALSAILAVCIFLLAGCMGDVPDSLPDTPAPGEETGAGAPTPPAGGGQPSGPMPDERSDPDLTEDSFENRAAVYYRYFSENNQVINPPFAFPSDGPAEDDAGLMMFAVLNIGKTYEEGMTKDEVDAILIKYFGRTAQAYETGFTEVSADGKIRSTGWDVNGTYRLVLTGLKAEPDGSKTGIFDMYYIPELYFADDPAAYAEMDRALFSGDGADYLDLYHSSFKINFFERHDETGAMYLEYISRHPAAIGEKAPDPEYDPETFLSDAEFVTAQGVRLGMTFDEVSNLLNGFDDIYNDFETFKSAQKGPVLYGFNMIDESFSPAFDPLRDGGMYLTYLSLGSEYPSGPSDPMPRGIRIGDSIEDVFAKFPIRDTALRKWADQHLYGPYDHQNKGPYAFLEYSIYTASYRICLVAETHVMNISFDRENKVHGADLSWAG